MLKLEPIKQQLADFISFSMNQENPQEFSLRPSEVFDLIEYPQDSQHGDYAFPCFKLSKILRKSPPEIAKTLTTLLDTALNKLTAEEKNNHFIKEIKSLGGFLNFKINSSYLAQFLIPQIEKGSFFQHTRENLSANAKRIMVEYSQPNTHKEFHVGHGRNVCLGNHLYRLYQYFGHETLGVNYIGDEGTHIAKCLYAITESKQTIPQHDRAEWLGKKYVESNQLLEQAEKNNDLAPKKKISQILSDIENKRDPIYSLWKETRDYCLQDFNKIYQWLDVHFDHVFYESEVSERSQALVDEYYQKGLLQESQGAIGIDMNDQNLGFMMVRKSDGNTLYITKDIALAEIKFNQFKIEKSIYVVGNEQDFHFKQLFNFLKLANFKYADQCFHLSYGMVRRADGKMSSRQGNSFTFLELIHLIKESVQPYLEKYKDQWSANEIEETANMVALGAIKYGMLNTDPKKDIVFEPDAWVRFEGNTGPYLMYCHSRAHSIIAKGSDLSFKPQFNHLSLLTHPCEDQLLLHLSKFNEVAFKALEQANSSLLTHYLFKLCQLFNQLYVAVPVLKEENERLLCARLALLQAFTKVLKQGLSLLGIKAPLKM